MILISHRGNINGIIKEVENHPSYIQSALDSKYHCEIDIWKTGDQLYLGHDEPTYKIEPQWLVNRKNKLWIHCKNIEALEYMTMKFWNLNFFWHEDDDYTLTSKGWVWAYPDKKTVTVPNRTIAVLPEWNDTDVSDFAGVCSDKIAMFK